DLDALLADLE
nr:Chain B, Paxillin [synthetic construct]